MGLMRFLRRQFGGPEMRPEAASSTPSLPAVGEPMLSVPAARPAGAVEPMRPLAGEAVLHFAERWDARVATFADPDVHREILRLHDMINQLHRQRRSLREERDRWERLARELERELVGLQRGGARDIANPLIAAEKFRRAKIVLARLTHPDTSGASGIEAGIRASVFREFWAEFERIEAEAPATA
jgi:hypothetical protein